MKRLLLFFVVIFLGSGLTYAQTSEDYLKLKLKGRENLTVKEWNTSAITKTKWLDRQTTYDSKGRKVEEIEYNQYGQAWRETCEYNEQNQKIREIHYNDKNKPTTIRKYEYNPDGTRKKQYNYAPNGKLMTVKVFEYSKSEGDEDN